MENPLEISRFFTFGAWAIKLGRELLALDVFEVSVTPSPMNNRTRVLSTKSATRDEGTILIQTKDGGFERMPVSEPFWWEIEEERERKAWKAARPVEILTFDLG